MTTEQWNNEGNNAFYESVKADGLQQLAEKAGLTTGCDMDLLTPYWSTAESILEVGAGYGRVIDYLLQHQFAGTITAIERCNVLFKHLERRYKKYKNIDLIHADILHLNKMDERFELILMLWSEIADFSPHEQILVFTMLAKLLQEKGRLIIDTMPVNVVPLGASKYGQQIIYSITKNITLHAYAPNTVEIKQYAQKAGFSNVACLNYQTNTDRERQLYILS